jgi:peptide/nickel transport system permease protein
MLQYLLKRIIFFIPTWIGVSILIFLLGNVYPYNPCEDNLSGSAIDKYSCNLKIKKLHLDKPSFYFNVTTQAYPDSLYKIGNPLVRANLERLIGEYGNWKAIETYYHSLVKITDKIYGSTTKENNDLLIQLRQKFPPILMEHKDEEILRLFKVAKGQFKENRGNIDLLNAIQEAEKNYETLKTTATPNKKYFPAIHFYGLDNQYHIWMANFVRLDFGKSYLNGEPVIDMIKAKLPVTLFLSAFSIIIAYLIAIQLGVKTAVRKGSSFDSSVNTGLFMLHSIPNFWIGMMMIVFLTSPRFLHLFPPGGLSDPDVQSQGSFIQQLLDYMHHLVLPIICWTYPSLAYLSRQMRGGMLNVMSEDYIRTARAKGVPPHEVTWKHSFRNALIPIITMLGSVLPRLIGGSIVLEWIFDIEGMGLLFFQAIGDHNHPVVFTIVMLIAILTVVGYLISDILYSIIDPRIRNWEFF